MPGFSFPAETFAFLDGIAAHNEKAWFDANRALYDKGYVEAGKAFVTELGPRLRAISPGVHSCPSQYISATSRKRSFHSCHPRGNAPT